MSIQVLTNHGDTLAAIYSSNTDWALGPMFLTDDSMSAEALAEKFVEWAGLRNRPSFSDWSDDWLEKKKNEFDALGWHKCKTCQALIQSHEDRLLKLECDACVRTCDECGDEDVYTVVVSMKTGPAKRLCPDCGVPK